MGYITINKNMLSTLYGMKKVKGNDYKVYEKRRNIIYYENEYNIIPIMKEEGTSLFVKKFVG